MLLRFTAGFGHLSQRLHSSSNNKVAYIQVQTQITITIYNNYDFFICNRVIVNGTVNIIIQGRII